jgi:hypothetical protein
MKKQQKEAGGIVVKIPNEEGTWARQAAKADSRSVSNWLALLIKRERERLEGTK